MQCEPMSLRAAIMLAAIIVPLVAWRMFRRQRAAVTLSTTPLLAAGPKGLRGRLYRTPDVLRLLALIALLVALARPREGEESVHVSSEGVAIMMLVDRSTSMDSPMQIVDKDTLSRLDMVKRVFKAFVLGGDGLPGRPNDLVGLSTFAMFGEQNCPLTLDRDGLALFIDGITLATPVEDRTAIGDGLRHAALSLIAATARTPAKSKFIILLSDGEQNAGELTPEEGARMAASHGIKVHCIFVSSPMGARQYVDFFGRVMQIPTEVSTGDELKEVASITGGTFSEATDGKSLLEITRRIDQEEKTEIRQKVVRYRERFGLPLVIGIALLGIELLFRATMFLRIP
ncbi:VWA domain-containing protein [Candidatus Fermentibacteria bacterium]|nr:VWA domain-containing protein [Candidatus Fermentibacteria bacterium]